MIVATATYIHPDWRGCLTLELVNLGDAPMTLWCGAPIAQLVIQEGDPPFKVNNRLANYPEAGMGQNAGAQCCKELRSAANNSAISGTRIARNPVHWVTA